MCEHQWIVFSTALREVALMLECASCQAFGIVPDPSKQEWSDAYHAPSDPYEWTGGNERVIVRGSFNKERN